LPGSTYSIGGLNTSTKKRIGTSRRTLRSTAKRGRPLRFSDAGVNNPATRKNSGIPNITPTIEAISSRLRSGSPTGGSSNTHPPRPVHAIVTCATITPVTSAILRLSG
jgi:hypothetical protein